MATIDADAIYKEYTAMYDEKTSSLINKENALYEEMREFYVGKLTDGTIDIKSIRHNTNTFARATNRLIKRLKKEIQEYTKDELEDIAKELIDYSAVKSFFNHYYKNHKQLFSYDYAEVKKPEITEDIYLHYEEKTEEIKAINPELYNQMKLYFFDFFGKSKSKEIRKVVNKSIRVTNFLMKNLNKDLKYCTNEEIEALVENMSNTDRDMLRTFLNHYSINIEKSCKYGYDTELVSDIKGYITYEEASKVLGVSKNTVRFYVRSKKIKDKKMYKRKLYINEKEILNLKNKEKSDLLTTVEASELLDMTPQHVLLLCKQGEFKNAVMEESTNRWSIPKEEIEEFINSKKSMKYAPDDMVGLFEYLTSNNASKYKKMYEIYKSYTLLKVQASNVIDKPNMIKRYALTFNRLAENLEKQLYLYENKELIELIKKKVFNTKDEPILVGFFKYYRVKEKNCKYNSVITPKRVKPKKSKEEEKDKIYSKIVWTTYYFYLTNIDLHFESAIKSPKYASIWIYTMLHLIIGWRASDFKRLPNIKLEALEIYDFEWFLKNDFTLSIAEELISVYKVDCLPISANKTRANAHFTVPLDMMIPVAIALIVVEIHRRKSNEEMLLFSFKKELPKRKDFKNFFEEESLVGFTSIKANRSLLTHSFNFATKQNGNAMLAYSYSTYLRSHKLNKRTFISNMTSQYIYATDDDGSLDDVTYNLFRRGHFGWLYHKIVEVAHDDFNTLSMGDVTKLIVNMENNIKSSELEVLSGFLLSKHDKKVNIIQELLQMDKKILKNKLKKIIKGEMPSKMEHAQCFVSEKCINPLATTCLGCDYILPMNYILITLNKELIEVATLLSNIPEYKESERIKYTVLLKKLLNMLKDFKEEYQEYDKEFMMKYIDMKKIQSVINDARKKYLAL